MHIVFFTPAWPPGKLANGIVTYCKHIVPELIAKGHEVTIICGRLDADTSNAYSVSNVKFSIWDKLVFRLIGFFSNSLKSQYVGYKQILKTLKLVMKKKPIDIFEMEETFGWCYRIQRTVKFPVVIRLHGPFFLNGSLGQKFDSASYFSGRVKREKEAFKGGRFITSPSLDVLKRTKLHANCCWSLERVIPNPIGPHSGDMWSREKSDPRQILYVGRFDMHKGGDIVLRAFDILVDKYPDVKLVFIGPDIGVIIDGNPQKYHEYVSKNISDKALNNIEFKGLVPHSEIMHFRLASAFTVLASRYENFSYAALESIIIGAPTICPDVGGFGEIISDGESGLHFTVEDPESLAKAMETMLENPQSAADFGSNGAVTARERFSPEVVARATLKFYDEVLGFS